MPAFICSTCGTQYPPSEAPPTSCPVCEDERQFLPPEGQSWTTLERLRNSHHNGFRQYEPGLIGIGTTPKFAIGQRALLLLTPEGNILWDCITLIDDAIVSFEAEGRLDALTAMRQSATSPSSRLLLALLLNARGPRDLLTLIEAHSRCADPIGEALRMAAQLLSEAPLSAGADQLPPEDFPLALSILRQFLREVPLNEVPASLAAEHPEIPAQTLQVRCQLLAESTMFRSLCQPAL